MLLKVNKMHRSSHIVRMKIYIIYSAYSKLSNEKSTYQVSLYQLIFAKQQMESILIHQVQPIVRYEQLPKDLYHCKS